MIEGCRLIPKTPPLEDYLRLRAAAGLSPRSRAAATAGLPNTWFGEAVGMGRIVGDGGLTFQIVDIAVDPAHQGRGLGKAIVGALVAHLRSNAPAEAHVSLLADGEAHRLYQQFGFVLTAPASVGMAMWVR
jgi:ribosomal protein S18 acetylase RimI-like enzyme